MKSTAKTVGIVMIITFLSRFLAFASNWVYTTRFGLNDGLMDIFSLSQQLPNAVFTVLGTALTILIIPRFAGLVGTGQKEKAFRFADTVISFSITITIALSAVCILATPVYLKTFTRFKTGDEYVFARFAVSIMLPVMVFYAMNYILQGILQSQGRFNMPAFVSVPSSLTVILYVILLGDRFGMWGLVVATFIALSLQALILIPPVFKTEYRFHIRFDPGNAELRQALRLLPPVLLGTSAYQVNAIVNQTVATNMDKSVSGAIYIVQFLILYSVLAFIFSITSVLFPKFAVLAASGDMEGFKGVLTSVIRTVMYFTIPLTFGFIVARYPLMDFLYGWGKMTGSNITLTSSIAAFYALGIIGVGIKEILDRVFYSLNDTRRPAINGVIIMAVNILGNLLLIRVMGFLGLPFAYSVASLTGGAVLMVMLVKKIGPFGGRALVMDIIKMGLSGLIMFTLVYFEIKLFGGVDTGKVLIDKAIRLFIPAGTGVVVYFAATLLLRIEEATLVAGKVKAKIGMGSH